MKSNARDMANVIRELVDYEPGYQASSLLGPRRAPTATFKTRCVDGMVYEVSVEVLKQECVDDLDGLPAGGMQVTAKKLLKRIEKLRETAFTQPAHWTREPTKAMLRDEKAYVARGKRDYAKLKRLVRELGLALTSPFVG